MSVTELSKSTLTESVRMLLTVRETAELLRVSESTIWHMAKNATIPAPVRVGGKRFWRRADLDDFLAGGGTPAPTRKDRRGTRKKNA